MTKKIYVPSNEQWNTLDNNFTYHPPTEEQREKYEILRDAAKSLASLFITNAPQSRELSLALTNLEQAVFWVNAAIARNEK